MLQKCKRKDWDAMSTKRRTPENAVEELSGHDKAIEHQGKYHLRSRWCFPCFSKGTSSRLCAPKNGRVSATRVAASGVGIRVAVCLACCVWVGSGGVAFGGGEVCEGMRIWKCSISHEWKLVRGVGMSASRGTKQRVCERRRRVRQRLRGGGEAAWWRG